MTSGVRGADPDAIECALAEKAPLSGLNGFAGQLPDDRLVRDVLGREPLFVDGEQWARSAEALADPTRFPPGSVGLPGESPTPVLSLPSSTPKAREEAITALESAVGSALNQLPDTTPVGFSGGLDSSLIAAYTNGPCYVVGVSEAPDIEAARSGASEIDRDLREIPLTLDALRESVPVVAKAAGTTNPIDVAIALGLYHLGRRIEADGFDTIALGQGADELFGGYEKVANAPTDDRVIADSILGARDEVLETIPRQAARDVQVLRAAGVEPIMPYLDDAVVTAALDLPEELLVSDGVRKTGLRNVAGSHLPQSLLEREKKALQYGSRISRELDRMARQAGYKRREPNHVRRYIENRIQDG